LAHQFGPQAAGLLEGDLAVRRSKATGRVREIYLGDVRLGTIRAGDGLFVPSLEGAERLLRLLPRPRLRVVVQSDVAAHVAMGLSVFCKHVVEADPEIRPLDEVIVVDENDNLVAVGKALLPGFMMRRCCGQAVKVRRGVGEKKR